MTLANTMAARRARSTRRIFLACKAGEFELAMKCAGQKGCYTQGTDIRCDASVGNVGDPCTEDDGMACAGDHKSRLVCKNKEFVTSEPCEGPNGCSVKAGKIYCDFAGKVGGACGEDDTWSCSADHKQEFVCRGKTLALAKVC